jgi:kinesin family protein 3/17
LIIDKEANQISLKKPNEKKELPKSFAFDAIFGSESSQRSIYEDSAFPLIESVLEGYNGKLFLIYVRNYFCLRSNWMWKNFHNGWM